MEDKVLEKINEKSIDEERLRSLDLPIFKNSEELAEAIGITISQLNFLAFSSKSHYIHFKISKKTGGERSISAPMPKLKQVQTWILQNILNKIELHEAAHGFRRDRSIVSNAKLHLGSDVIINLDIKDFFPSISYKRIKKLFASFGYSQTIATILALLCSEPAAKEDESIEKTNSVAKRYLPQGSPASPAISNILCYVLDLQLTQMSEKLGFVYTRYADDLTFSASRNSFKHISNLLNRTEAIPNQEGFTIESEKTKIMTKNEQQKVTGVVVNKNLSLDRKDLKRFRSLLFQIDRDGLEGKKWGNSKSLIASIQGFTAFIAMVNPQKASQFQRQIKQIQSKFEI